MWAQDKARSVRLRTVQREFSSLALNAADHLFAGSAHHGVYYSVDDGASWRQITTGLTNTRILSLAVDADQYLFAGTEGSGVFRSFLPTSIPFDPSPENPPQDYILRQNYPNHIRCNSTGNASTIIAFDMRSDSYVPLKLFNLLGEEVATLVQERRVAGEHRVQWQPNALPSGVYVYRLQVGQFVQSRKLVLLR